MKRLLCKARQASLILLAALTITLSLASCKDNEYDAEGLTVTDALGREVTLSREPERVAALLGSLADIWSLAGGELCAAPDDAWEDFGLALDNAVNIGGAHSPSLELLLSADPDLVLASASTASNIELLEPLVTLGITVVYFDIDNFNDYLAMLDICSELTGRYDLYETNGLALKEQIDEIKLEYADKALPEEERSILLLRASSSSVKAKGSNGTVLGEMLADIGCINIADSERHLLEDLSVETVIREEPYHIFAVTMGSDTEAARRSIENMIKEDKSWSTLTAVKEGRVHIMDKRLFNLKPNGRWAEAYRALYETLTEA